MRGGRDGQLPAGRFQGHELWLVDLETCGPALDTLEAADARLSAEDERRIAQGADETVRRERRRAHIALRLLVERAFGSRWRGVAYDVSPAGKPSLPGAGGSFSLSHISGIALIGLASPGPIGVDVERERPLRVSDERRRRIEGAAVRLAGGAPLPQAPEPRFMQAWVRLEARAKADGGGIGPLLERSRAGARRAGESASAEQGRAGGAGNRTVDPFVVFDVTLGGGLFAAVAMPAGAAAPPVFPLPGAAGGLRRLLAGAGCGR